MCQRFIFLQFKNAEFNNHDSDDSKLIASQLGLADSISQDLQLTEKVNSVINLVHFRRHTH